MYWSNSARSTTFTLNSMREWSTPHSSAHLPANVPTLFGRELELSWSCPG